MYMVDDLGRIRDPRKRYTITLSWSNDPNRMVIFHETDDWNESMEAACLEILRIENAQRLLGEDSPIIPEWIRTHFDGIVNAANIKTGEMKRSSLIHNNA